jgi:hypothetical protein
MIERNGSPEYLGKRPDIPGNVHRIAENKSADALSIALPGPQLSPIML